MSKVFQGWTSVAAHLDGLAQGATMVLNEGQRWSLRKIAERLPESGLVLADEVGMGKTRIASAVANAVIAAGGAGGSASAARTWVSMAGRTPGR